MNRSLQKILCFAIPGLMPGLATAEPATVALGRDYSFPKRIVGFEAIEVHGLEVNTFTTSDGVKLTYWEAGKGEPLSFVAGRSGNGAQHINLMRLLSRRHHVFVLDQRNPGLVQRVEHGGRIRASRWISRNFRAHRRTQGELRRLVG